MRRSGETINGKVRAECQNTGWFMPFDEAREYAGLGARTQMHPHNAIGDKCPVQLMNCAKPYGAPGA